MAFATDDPLGEPVGLERLAVLDSLEVNSTRSWTSIKFEFRERSGELLFAAHQPRVVGFGMGFDITLCDANNVEVITLRRRNTICHSKVEVSIRGVLASIVRPQFTCLKPLLEVHDAHDTPVYRIKGPWHQIGDFQLSTLDDVPVGTITKKWAGWSKELFNYSRDDFTVVFPRDLDVKYKAACIGAVVHLIYARRNQRR